MINITKGKILAGKEVHDRGFRLSLEVGKEKVHLKFEVQIRVQCVKKEVRTGRERALQAERKVRWNKALCIKTHSILNVLTTHTNTHPKVAV